MYKHKKTHKPWSMSIWGGPDRRRQQEIKATRTKENSNVRTERKHKQINNKNKKISISNFSPTTSGKQTIYWEAVFGLI